MAAQGTMCHISNRFRELYLLTKSLTKSLLIIKSLANLYLLPRCGYNKVKMEGPSNVFI